MSAILERLKPETSEVFIKVVKVVASCRTEEQYNCAIQWAERFVKPLDTVEKAMYLGVLTAKQLEFERGL